MGWGSYSPDSQIRVRMLSFGPGAEPDAGAIADRVAASIGRRAAFLVDGRTDAFRLVNAENDALPGTTVDWYAGWAVAQFTSAGAEFWKNAVAEAVMRFMPGCRGVYERSDADVRTREGLELRKGPLAGEEPPEAVEIRENGVRFLVDVRGGHKTGFYLDQRDARAVVARFANGAEVLNCFSYTGGFGLAAAAAGASLVVDVDASADALALARKNEALNACPGTTFEYVEADVFKQLRRYRDEGRQFDLVVLDPPKFADAKSGLMRALRGYKDINLIAMKLLRPGGVLATFSCSGAVTPEIFGKVCAEAAFDSGRDFQTVARTGHGADHPVSLAFPEGADLKGLVLRECGAAGRGTIKEEGEK